jgi:ABC-type polysaccharide transport system, permease component
MNSEAQLSSSVSLDAQYLKKRKREATLKKLKSDSLLYVLLIPGILYYVIFKFVPMYGIIIAFKDYSPFLGIGGSPWVGVQQFTSFFKDPDFFRLLFNTLFLSFLSIVFYFPAPIIIALLLNELRVEKYKKTVQTMVYIPHFVSMVIVASITYVIFNTEGGPINQMLFNLTGGKIDFLGSPNWFRPLIILQTIWKECGWGTIIFLAALSGVDVQLYEAAVVDGAGRFKQLWHVTLPSIRSTIVILLIMRMGSVLSNGFEQIFLMTNSLNRGVADVFDTYVYTLGVTQGAFSYSTAVGLFKSIVGLILILSTDKIAKKMGESGLF